MARMLKSVAEADDSCCMTPSMLAFHEKNGQKKEAVNNFSISISNFLPSKALCHSLNKIYIKALGDAKILEWSVINLSYIISS